MNTRLSLSVLTELKNQLAAQATEQLESSQPYRIATLQDATHTAFTAYLDPDLVRILTRSIELEEQAEAAMPDPEAEAHRLELLAMARVTLAAHEAVAPVMRPIIDRLMAEAQQDEEREERQQRATQAAAPAHNIKVGMN